MRRQRLLQLAAAALVALVLVRLAVAAVQPGASSAGPPGTVAGAAAVKRLFAGIPQRGIELGSRSVPVTLTEFADLQCPFCRRFAVDVLPTLVERYVRRGRLRIVFRDIAFLGPESTAAGLFAASAGRQDRLWQFVDLFYRNQGPENSGYVTDALLRRLARAVPGLSADRAFAAREGRAAAAQLAEARVEAARFGIESTPSFLLTRRGGRTEPLRYRTLSPEPFTAQIDAALRRR